MFSGSSNTDKAKKDTSVIHHSENVAMAFCLWVQGLQIAVLQEITSRCTQIEICCRKYSVVHLLISEVAVSKEVLEKH